MQRSSSESNIFEDLKGHRAVHLICGDTFQESQWMCETAASTNPIYIFPIIHTYDEV